MPKKSKPEVTEIPDERSFAIHLAECFLEEAEISIDFEEDQTALDVVLEIADVNKEFSLWLAKIIHSQNFEETKSQGLLN